MYVYIHIYTLFSETFFWTIVASQSSSWSPISSLGLCSRMTYPVYFAEILSWEALVLNRHHTLSWNTVRTARSVVLKNSLERYLIFDQCQPWWGDREESPGTASSGMAVLFMHKPDSGETKSVSSPTTPGTSLPSHEGTRGGPSHTAWPAGRYRARGVDDPKAQTPAAGGRPGCCRSPTKWPAHQALAMRQVGRQCAPGTPA